MEAALFAALIEKVGLPLAEDLLKLASKGGQVSYDEWIGLKKKNATPFDDLVPPRPAEPANVKV
jgi:hypothetical protein